MTASLPAPAPNPRSAIPTSVVPLLQTLTVMSPAEVADPAVPDHVEELLEEMVVVLVLDVREAREMEVVVVDEVVRDWLEMVDLRRRRRN